DPTLFGTRFRLESGWITHSPTQLTGLGIRDSGSTSPVLRSNDRAFPSAARCAVRGDLGVAAAGMEFQLQYRSNRGRATGTGAGSIPGIVFRTGESGLFQNARRSFRRGT